jgi:hypothetical protein
MENVKELWNDVRQNKISYWIDDVQMVRSAGQDKFKVFFNVTVCKQTSFDSL